MASAAPPRRTQAQRRAASRIRLLDAALECLADRGYAGTTFPEIVRRAGLSNGAVWRHFRSKEELLVAAALHSEGAVSALPAPVGLDRLTPEEGLDSAVDYFWRNYVSSPAFQALIELLRASRSDPDLAAMLSSVDQRAAELVFATFARLVGPELAADPSFRRNVRLVGLTLYGVGLTAHLRSSADEPRLAGEVKQMLRALFGLPAPA
ncbi:MAG: TetR/AcrR family transcriptional regulator [Actinobacteria bacterium]|nr:MAG: TetR/AcrR family transcriptional regulator [Actinomycetota bacterium]